MLCLRCMTEDSVKPSTRFKDQYEFLLVSRDRAVAASTQAAQVALVPLKEEIDRLLSGFVADQQNGADPANAPVSVSASVTTLTAQVGGEKSGSSSSHAISANPNWKPWVSDQVPYKTA